MAQISKVGDDMKTGKYISDEAVQKRAVAAVKIELEKKKAMDMPITIYDRQSGKVYLENSDGSTSETRTVSKRGRYSERISKKA